MSGLNSFDEYFIDFIQHTGDSAGLIAALLTVGFLQGPLLPAVSSIAAAWYPIEERGRIVSVIFMGINVRNKIQQFQIKQTQNSNCEFQMGGILAAYLVGLAMHASKRWDIVFYGLALVTAIIGILFVRIMNVCTVPKLCL